MRHSETAFVRPRPDGDFGLRWFSPTNEVPLCGHGTLAAAAALAHQGRAAAPLAFHTLSGVLRVGVQDGRFSIELPAPLATRLIPLSEKEAAESWGDVIEIILGPAWRDKAEAVLVNTVTKKLLIRVRTPSEVASLPLPSASLLRAAHDGSLVRGVVVTARDQDGEYRFVCRYFAPWNGIEEDPVNGAGHVVSVPYWAGEMPGEAGAPAQLTSTFLSPGRGGEVVPKPQTLNPEP
ncbi:hypothetical protein T484DRAFT_1875771 [Baffinella frigidus]|nr:hypothetical protein T484DRAFT_1875771 [Cryptophyta sp. CCMP2293]